MEHSKRKVSFYEEMNKRKSMAPPPILHIVDAVENHNADAELGMFENFGKIKLILT